MTADTCLNIVLPAGLEDAVSDLLLAHPKLEVNFASFRVEAHGPAVELRSAAEHVSGHAERVQMQLVMTRPHAEAMLTYLCESLPRLHIFYWMTPVLVSGRLG